MYKHKAQLSPKFHLYQVLSHTHTFCTAAPETEQDKPGVCQDTYSWDIFRLQGLACAPPGLLTSLKILSNNGLRKQILGLGRYSVGKGPSSNPKYPHRKPAMAVCSCDLALQGREREILRACSSTCLAQSVSSGSVTGPVLRDTPCSPSQRHTAAY